jgi:putative transposase
LFRNDIGKILLNACPDHIHMLVPISPKISFMGYLKLKNSIMIFDRHAKLRYKYGIINFWCRGYYVIGLHNELFADLLKGT